MKKLLIFLVVGLMVEMSFAADAPVAQKKLISLDFPDASLSTVLDVLSIKTGQKFITDTELARKRIVLNLKDVAPDEALNALLDTYNLYYVRQPGTNIYVIKNKGDNTAMTTVSKVIFLNYASAKDMEAVLKQNLTKSGSLNVEDRTNSIIINDATDNIEKIEALIRAVDIPTMQVLLEAKIVNVKIDSDMQLGADLSKVYKTGSYWSDPLVSQQNSAVSGSALRPQVSYSSLLAPGLSSSGKLNFSILHNNYDIEGVLEALKADSNAKVLSNPRLLVINNEEATIDIVDQVPYEARTLTATGVATISTEFKEVGIKLKVKPQINRDGSIILSVTPEQSFRTAESIGNVPVINTSKSNTTFMMRDGETAVIGGLIRESDTASEYKVPLLGDIPVLGFLFKKYAKNKSRTELTIFITARIVQH